MNDRYNVRVALRDGVSLSADVYLPDEPSRHPAIVTRTPYNKNTAEAYTKGRAMAARGYAFVWMDVRGRGDSDGTFVPWRREGQDGYDAVEWAAEQDWCTGEVVTWGWSYSSYNQWLAALERPPHLRAMITYGSPQDPYPIGEWPTGTHPPLMLAWCRFVDGRTTQHIDPLDWPTIYQHLPIVDQDEIAGFSSDYWHQDHAHPTLDEYWEPMRYSHRIPELDVPVLHVTGWYDDGAGTYRNFERMSKHAATERARRAQTLIVGPWIHEPNKDRRIGEIDFGPHAVIDLDDIESAWMNRWLRQDSDNADPVAPVRIFIMGDNQWRDEQEWPLARTTYTPYYLDGSNANSRFGNGTLTADRPANEARNTYLYDPLRPVPYIYDPVWFQLGGPDDYSAIQQRGDVLVYTSQALATPLEITGPVGAVIHAASSARDTDFTVKLLDTHPNGFSQRLCDGIVRGRFRNGLEQERLLTPGQIYRLDVDLWYTSHVFQPGHRICVEIASSAFPKYARNTNTGETLATDTKTIIAENVVWHGGRYDSHVLLPIIDRPA